MSNMKFQLKEKGQGIASRAGEGFELTVSPGQKRANAKISTTDIKSMARNKKHNILLKAMR